MSKLAKPRDAMSQERFNHRVRGNARRSGIVLFLHLLLGLWAPLTLSATPVLLIPGLTIDFNEPDQVWGMPGARGWGLIHGLQQAGYRYKGALKADSGYGLSPHRTVFSGKRPAVDRAEVFELRFSAAAKEDGIGFKALEVARAIAAVRHMTGEQQVTLVAFSAGGVAARAYVQGALPGLPYREDVAKLITIGTPHMGAALATGIGDLIGTRATALKPDAQLITNLNEHLELPDGIFFASVIVRGKGADERGRGSSYTKFYDPSQLEPLPVDLRIGGDQVVHVVSQNLALTTTARRYEKRTGRPVLYPLERVMDPDQRDLSWLENKVHSAGPSDSKVVNLVRQLLDDTHPWSNTSAAAGLQQRQLALFAEGFLADLALKSHWISEVVEIRMDALKPATPSKKTVYRVSGTVHTRGKLLGVARHRTRINGLLHCRFDRFGRIMAASFQVGV